MKKHTSVPPANPLENIYDPLILTDWLERNSRTLVAGLVILVAALFGLYRWHANSTLQTEKDYLVAAKEFAVLQQNPSDANALKELTQVLNKTPDLHSKYDGVTAQLLLTQSNTQAALPFAERTLKRMSTENIPYQVEFAEITLLISQENYKAALDKSIALKQHMHNNETTDAGIYSLNLIRIALLQQQLNNPKEELAAWNEWKNASQILSNSKTYYSVLNIFNEGQFSLEQYIQSRLPLLNK